MVVRLVLARGLGYMGRMTPTKLRFPSVLLIAGLVASLLHACGGDDDGGDGGTGSEGTDGTGGTDDTTGSGGSDGGTGSGDGGSSDGGGTDGTDEPTDGGFPGSTDDECIELGYDGAADLAEIFGAFSGSYAMQVMTDCATDSMSWVAGTDYTVTVVASELSITAQSEDGDITLAWDQTDDWACSRTDPEGTLILTLAEGSERSLFMHNLSLPAMSLTVRDGTTNPTGCQLSGE
jgi:hypothetical protein